ncbi:hypothetical protein SprV_0802484000 [Sparganum proliferum]
MSRGAIQETLFAVESLWLELWLSPMARSRRPRSVRKSRNAAIAAQERTYVKAPHSFVFARTGVGSLVKQLSLDLRRVFEPFTASSLRVSKRNVLKDFINIAGPLNVTHLLYLTHPRADKLSAKRARHAANISEKIKKKKRPGEAESTDFGDEEPSLKGAVGGAKAGGVYMHLVRAPNGPSLTFRVLEYSLTKDVFTLVRRVFDARQFTTPPLLAMTGFGSTAAPGAKAPPPPHLRLMVDMFQNMLPPLNVQKLKLSTVRRVLLLSREVDSVSAEEVIYLRHFHIRIENRSVSKALRRLGVGGAPLRKRLPTTGGLGPGGSGKSSGVPSLAKYASLDDYLTKASLLTDSGMSDVDDIAEVELPGGGGGGGGGGGATSTSTDAPLENVQKTKSSSKRKQALADAKATHGFTHLTTCRKATIRLTEIGPRLTLKLIKIEEGVNSGSVLYHSWQVKSALEENLQIQKRHKKEAEKSARKAFQEQRRQEHEEAKALHRQSCLEGMRKAGQLPTEADGNTNNDADDDSASSGEQKPDVQRAEEEEEFDELIHQVTDDEAEEEEYGEDDGDEEMKEGDERKESRATMPLTGVSHSRRSGRIGRKKKLKIPRKHPAFKYLMEKKERRASSTRKKWSSRT